MGNLLELAEVFQSLEGLEQGPAAGPAVLLDTRKTSEHLRRESAPSKQRAKYERKKRRAIQSRLVALLRSMEEGEHGITAQMVGERWAGDVAHCGGRTRRHDVCGRPSWLPHSCKFLLCPWYQQSRAKKAGAKLHQLWTSGAIVNPLFVTYTVQNVDDLDGAWSDMRKALKGLHRRVYIKGNCRGGFRALETTIGSDGRWNAHAHELLDGQFMAQWPQTDLVWRAGKCQVKQEHPGLEKLWTMECQGMRRQDGKMVPRYPRLYRKGINVDCPEDWYMVHIKAADYGAIAEIAKYVAKGDEVVAGGAGKVVEYLVARAGKRMLQGFGSMYKVSLLEPEDEEGEEGEEDAFAAPTAPGECPYADCPDPRNPTWEFICNGPLEGWEKERDNRTGLYRLSPEGLIPPDYAEIPGPAVGNPADFCRALL